MVVSRQTYYAFTAESQFLSDEPLSTASFTGDQLQVKYILPAKSLCNRVPQVG
jgi:hypothetical protein